MESDIEMFFIEAVNSKAVGMWCWRAGPHFVLKAYFDGAKNATRIFPVVSLIENMEKPTGGDFHTMSHKDENGWEIIIQFTKGIPNGEVYFKKPPFGGSGLVVVPIADFLKELLDTLNKDDLVELLLSSIINQ